MTLPPDAPTPAPTPAWLGVLTLAVLVAAGVCLFFA
jgi:hypothetical protein